MFVNGSVAFDHVDFTIGDMVNITTESGLLVGEMEILENGYLMTGPIYGDDLTTEAVDGALKDEALIFTFDEFVSEWWEKGGAYHITTKSENAKLQAHIEKKMKEDEGYDPMDWEENYSECKIELVDY